ncbi:MAG: Tad domain-containing protein [Acidobacteriota bacterium]|nr:Tad domain-containing protein [Acidobacteriota bacterium]
MRSPTLLRRILHDESGQALVFTLLCIPVLAGFLGLAVDVGDLFRTKRQMQAVADAAAIAAAAELNYGNSTTAATGAATQSGYTSGSNGFTLTVNMPPQSGPHAGVTPNGYVEVIASLAEPTYLMKLFNIPTVTVAARAVSTQGAGQGCIYTLGGPSSPGISMNGNTTINVSTCGISDNGNLSMVGNASLTAKSIGVGGSYSSTKNVTVSPTPVSGIAPVSDPLAYLAAPSYNSSSCVTMPSTNPLTPGCYNGISLGGNSSLTLSSGTYIINGNFSISGKASITGTGVTLVLLGSTSIVGTGVVDLTAPTSGTYSGILFYQPSTNTNSITLVGNSGSTIEGVQYAPSADVSFTGNSGSTIYTDFVANSLSLVGNSSFQSYASLPGATSPITTAVLVE